MRIDGARAATADALPFPRWRWGRSDARFTAFAFVAGRGTFERIEVENPFREAREVRLAFELRAARPGRPRLTGSCLASAEGEVLVSFAGGGLELVRSWDGGALVELVLVLPARARRVVELVLAPRSGARASSLELERGRLRIACEELRETHASVRFPEELFDRAFERAWAALALSVAPGEGGGLWLRPGAPPEAGPATLDAIALRALDLWGGGALVERCLANAFAFQGVAAPPGERFRSARGYLSAPLDGPVRGKWASDCGALLWAASARADVGASAAYLRSARPHIEAACSWILGELGPEGLLPEALAPDPAMQDRSAWNDVWSWKGLDAAARALGRSGAGSAAGIRSAADRYRLSIERAMGIDRFPREHLETLGRLDAVRRRSAAGGTRPESSARSSDPAVIAAQAARELATPGLDPEAELRVSASFLTALRKILILETDDAIHLLPLAPARWFAAGRGFSVERLPSSRGPVSMDVFVAGGGARLVADLRLPRGARAAVLRLPGDGIAWRIHANGARVRSASARAGLVRLPAGGGHYRVEAVRGR